MSDAAQAHIPATPDPAVRLSVLHLVPFDQNPTAIYLASLSDGSRRIMSVVELVYAWMLRGAMIKVSMTVVRKESCADSDSIRPIFDDDL